jgi:hypothetical protein
MRLNLSQLILLIATIVLTVDSWSLTAAGIQEAKRRKSPIDCKEVDWKIGDRIVFTKQRRDEVLFRVCGLTLYGDTRCKNNIGYSSLSWKRTLSRPVNSYKYGCRSTW